MAMQGLLDNGDEVLIPAPDYPLWTAAVNLAGGNPVHYLCDEKSMWYPDLDDIEEKISSKTKGLVIISPNNPTGSVYPPEIVEKLVALANEHGLVVFSDEIYERIVYDGAKHTPPALYADKTLCVSFNGLSKAYRAAGFRAGWMLLSGAKTAARDYREGIDILSNMRLCSNVPSQYSIQAALGGYQSIDDLVAPGGRLYEQMEIGWERINSIPGLSCVRPQGALYLFPCIDVEQFSITSDEQFVLDLLREKKILVVQGTGFNWPRADHFRIVFLPPKEELKDAMSRLEEFMTNYRQFLTR
jgi:alanine-synthesizing transaminase